LAQTEFLGLGADITPSIGFDLGNVMIDASAGGHDPHRAATCPAITARHAFGPACPVRTFFLSDTDTGRDFGWYVFAGAEGRVVAHNIFLDGNSFATSQSVPKKTLVADFQIGAAIILYGVPPDGDRGHPHAGIRSPARQRPVRQHLRVVQFLRIP